MTQAKIRDILAEVYAAIAALREALAQPEQEPSEWRDMIVATLVREGVNKHKARELADHFAAQPEQEPVAGRAFLERVLVAMEGVIDVADRKTDEFDALRSCIIELTLMLYTTSPAPQRQWVGLTDDDWVEIGSRKNTVLDTFACGAAWAADQLEERNT